MPTNRQPLTAEQLLAMPPQRRTALAEYAEVLEANNGCSTPAEEFICNLVNFHVNYAPLTPDDIADDIEEFREHFEMAIKEARQLVRQYPALILGNGESWQGQVHALEQRGDNHEEQAVKLDVAREAMRLYPSLVMAPEMPEPWRSALDE